MYVSGDLCEESEMPMGFGYSETMGALILDGALL